MNKIKTMMIGLMLAMPFASWASSAVQEDSVTSLKHYKFLDNMFVGIHVGPTSGLVENMRPRDYFKLGAHHIGGGITIGKNFSPEFGVRIGGYYMNTTGVAEKSSLDRVKAKGLYDGDGFYKIKNINGYIDALPNLTNIFSKYKESRRLNVLGIFGIGFTHSNGFDTDEIDAIPGYDYNVVSGAIDNTKRTFFSARAGLGLAYKLCEVLDLTFEATVNATDDGFDGFRYDDKYDGYTTGLFGLTYHFKDHYGDRRFKYRTVGDDLGLDDLNNKINQTRKDLEDAKNRHGKILQQRILDMTVSFPIDKYFISDIQKRNVEAVANYIKSHPEMNVVICGYADVETAYPAYNMRLSKRRVTSVFNMLVNEYGVNPNRLRYIMAPFIKQNEMDGFCNEIMSFAVNPDHVPKPWNGLKGTLTSFDVRHLTWNIAARLGLGKGKPYSVETCVNFIRAMFPDLCEGLDSSTLKNLRVASTSDKIHIDEPGCDGVTFHIPKT